MLYIIFPDVDSIHARDNQAHKDELIIKKKKVAPDMAHIVPDAFE